jgi:hypothetical protein
MNSAVIALGAGIAGLCLGFGVAVLSGDLSAQDAAPARVQPLLHAAALPWAGASRSLLRAALPQRASLGQTSPSVSLQPLPGGPGTSAMHDGGAPEDSLADDANPGIGEPVDSGSYLDARDRAAGHSARSR